LPCEGRVLAGFSKGSEASISRDRRSRRCWKFNAYHVASHTTATRADTALISGRYHRQ
jgi:hypothetical protein